jgi:hypothetical protein
MRLAGPRTADEDDVVRGLGEGRAVELAHQRFIDGAAAELEAGQVAVRAEARRLHLVGDQAHRALGPFGLQQLVHQRFGVQRSVAAMREQ